MPIQQCWVCTHLQQEAHHARLPRDDCQVQGRLVQVVGEVNNAKVSGMVDDMRYLLNDAGLPVDDGQVQRRVSVLVLRRQQVALSRQERAGIRRDAVVE